jgi:excinuclease ABC subunit B
MSDSCEIGSRRCGLPDKPTEQTNRVPVARSDRFELVCPYEPTGDQPAAIAKLTAGLIAGEKHQTLLGITGSGKTFTMAAVIEKVNRPTLVCRRTRRSAAQLFAEFKELFRRTPSSTSSATTTTTSPKRTCRRRDTFIEKDASRNENIERLRNSATRSLLERRDVIIVASVSCIYGLGSPDNYLEMALTLTSGRRSSARICCAR